MPKIIDMHVKDRPEFIGLLYTTRRHLTDATATVLDDATNFPLLGSWSAQQDVGTVETPEPLLDSGDSRIAALARLYVETMVVVESLRRRKQG
jgi:hypothetical protein